MPYPVPEALMVEVLEANLEALGLEPAEGELRRSDALAALRSARERAEKYDLVFIDPPYRQARDLAPELSALLPSVLGPAARVVVESDRRSRLALEMEIEHERRYGDTSITIHRHP